MKQKMRYLKRFNERSYYYNINNIKEFCEELLAYLLDYGFTINTHNNIDDVICININSNSSILWSKVKDHIIPFITILDDEYEIFLIKQGNNDKPSSYIDKPSHYIDDLFKNDFIFRKMSILIKERK